MPTMDVWSFNSTELQQFANTVVSATMNKLVADGLLTTEATAPYAAIIVRKGWFRGILDRLFKQEGGVVVNVTKLG